MGRVFVSILSILDRFCELCHLINQVLVCLELIAFVDWLQLGLFLPRLGDFMSQLLDRPLQFSLFLRQVIHTLCNIHEVSDSFVLLLNLIDYFRCVVHPIVVAATPARA